MGCTPAVKAGLSLDSFCSVPPSSPLVHVATLHSHNLHWTSHTPQECTLTTTDSFALLVLCLTLTAAHRQKTSVHTEADTGIV